MPSSWKLWTILLFWLATTFWLIQRDVWPRLRTGEPPPYTIDLADEALKSAPRISWKIFRGAKNIGFLNTWVAYRPQDDTFELHSEIPQQGPDKNIQLGSLGPFTIYL